MAGIHSLGVPASATLICRGERQRQFKNTPLKVRLDEPQTATVVLGDSLTNGKPQTTERHYIMAQSRIAGRALARAIGRYK